MSNTMLEALAQNHLQRIVLAIEHAVAKSFEEDGARMTGDEVRRRFSICEKLYRQLRGDLDWGVQRVLDHLPQYLRCELDGVPWEPDRRTCWMPEDGT